MKLSSLVNSSQDMRYMARRAFNSYCRAYSLLKDTDCFNLKKLNLHKLAKSYGLGSARSKGQLEEEGYTNMKDSKKISDSEAKFLELKSQRTLQGIKLQKQSQFINDEFAY